jgi:CubicO group peptidase (beta-lactamase class C family)
MRPSLFAIALAGLLLACRPSLAAAEAAGAALDALVAEALKAWPAPGLAVAVVRDDEVIYLKGHGVRRAGGKEPVTPDTLFAIGSCTKAFTATALALLVGEGKADWDDPVRKHLPWFRLADPLADRDVTLRDLLCHRTGLARHDLLWYRAPWSPEESVRRLAVLAPASSFRSRYEYNNLTYIAAGLAIDKAAGMPWHVYVQKRLFAPLDMKGAVFTRSAALAARDHATPHRAGPSGKPEPIEWYPDDKQVRASGSIKAGARDLSRWVRLQLGDGTFDGKRVVSAEALAETHAPQVVVPLPRAERRATETTQVSYGLGWRVYDYRGQHVLEHGGANDGFRARVLLLPRKKLGLALLTNVEEAEALQATAHALVDHLLGLPKKDWHAHYLAQKKRAEATRQAAAAKRRAGRRTGTTPSRELAAYAGRYREDAYGTVEVARAGGGLALSWSSFKVPLRHWHFDTFAVPERKGGVSRLAGELAAFTLDDEGEVKTLQFLGRTFRRAPP